MLVQGIIEFTEVFFVLQVLAQIYLLHVRKRHSHMLVLEAIRCHVAQVAGVHSLHWPA